MGKWCQINDLCKGLLTFGCTVSRCFRYISGLLSWFCYLGIPNFTGNGWKIVLLNSLTSYPWKRPTLLHPREIISILTNTLHGVFFLTSHCYISLPPFAFCPSLTLLGSGCSSRRGHSTTFQVPRATKKITKDITSATYLYTASDFFSQHPKSTQPKVHSCCCSDPFFAIQFTNSL